MFKHILVPLDGSPLAERALPIAARIARASGAQIHLIQVVNPVFVYAGGLAADVLLPEQQMDVEVAQATRYLKAVTPRWELSGIETTAGRIKFFAAISNRTEFGGHSVPQIAQRVVAFNATIRKGR